MILTQSQREVIRRCRQSVTWFLRSFGKVKHPSAGIIPFDTFSYQRHAIKCFRKYRMNIFRKCRQAGISKISGAFAAWFALFNSNKTILIVSRTDEDAMNFLRENILFIYNNLPDWMRELWKPVKQNEHEIVFPNGSRIRSLTSHPDVLRSNSSSLNIIDEIAFIQNADVMWAGGWSCAIGTTLVQTDDGLIPLQELTSGGQPWVNIDKNVCTDEGYKRSDRGFVNGVSDTKIVKTYLGYQFEGTPKHRLKVIDSDGVCDWRTLDNVGIGDIIVSLPGQFKGNRKALITGYELGPEFAEILGLYCGDGTINLDRPKRFKIVFDPQDVKTCDLIVNQFNGLGFGLPTNAYREDGNATVDFRINSAPFIELMHDNGLVCKTKPQDATIPPVILQSDKEVLCAFLRGLFDSDGWCYKSGATLRLGFSTTSDRLSEQVHVALHALGIIARRQYVTEHSDDRYSDEPYWRVEVWDAASKMKFRELIGFISNRKRECLDQYDGHLNHAEINHRGLVERFANAALECMLNGNTFRACTDRRKWNLYRIRRSGVVRLQLVKELATEFNLNDMLSTYVLQGLVFDIVESISDGRAETFDISVPDNSTYIANGFVSHNTLQHGGNVICISTTNGLGGWYWSTMTDAEAGVNQFNPIVVNWWDMDWVVEYTDPLSLQHMRIAPLDGKQDCKMQFIDHPKYGRLCLDPNKYGPYWSPWLEEQYRALSDQGESWKFEQEVLASFVGSGNTVLSKEAIAHVSLTVRDPESKVTGVQQYVHPVTGEHDELSFDFVNNDEGLWIWAKPVTATKDKYRGKELIERGRKAHSYVMGVDIASGQAKDYSTIEVFDIDTMEQVAEFMARVLPREFIKFIDRIGRYYNTALTVVERNNGGNIIIDQLRHDIMYPNLWRKKDINDKPMTGRNRRRAMKVGEYGYTTSQSSKATINKVLTDNIRDKSDNGEGYKILSKRLLKQLSIYVRKRDRAGRDTMKTEAEEGSGNHDDLVMATGLALIAAVDAVTVNPANLAPTPSSADFTSMSGPLILSDTDLVAVHKGLAEKGGPGLLIPLSVSPDASPEVAAQMQLEAFTLQLGGIPISQGKPLVVPKNYYFETK